MVIYVRLEEMGFIKRTLNVVRRKWEGLLGFLNGNIKKSQCRELCSSRGWLSVVGGGDGIERTATQVGFGDDAAETHREVQTAPEGRNSLKIRLTLKCSWFWFSHWKRMVSIAGELYCSYHRVKTLANLFRQDYTLCMGSLTTMQMSQGEKIKH